MMDAVWSTFDRVVVFDTETTGLEFETDRIIELGAVALENGVETKSMDLFIRLPEGQSIPPFITELTGITDDQLLSEGVSHQTAVEEFCGLLEGAKRPLLVAYNAQFDLNFLYYFLRPSGRLEVLREARFLDAMTVFKDRRDYPHKLCNAIKAYRLEDEVVNSHRAVDDARATVAVMEAMAEEQDDLERYVNLFGVHPKYGLSGKKISSVTYRTQPYRRTLPLYDLA